MPSETISEKNIEFIKTLQEIYAACSRNDKTLSKTDIADAMGVTKQSLDSGIKNKKSDFIDLDKLIVLHRSIHEDNDQCLKRLSSTVKKFFDLKLNIKHKELNDYQDEFNKINPEIRSLLTSASSSFIILSPQSWIFNSIPDILAANRSSIKLNLVVYISDINHAIEVIEQWAYSKNGNYTEILNVKIFERQYEPIAEMLSISIEGKYLSFLNNGEVYVPMSKMGVQFLLNEQEKINHETPKWALIKSPAARSVERLRRQFLYHFPDNASKQIIDFLSNKVEFYEKTCESENSKFLSVVSSEIRNLFDKDIADLFDEQIEYFTLLDK